MKPRSPIQPGLLSRMNARTILRALLQHGPQSRAELARLTGMTPPTVSKAVEALLSEGLLEERKPTAAFGRPAKKLVLATRSARVLGLVIDAGTCRVIATGLDGRISPSQSDDFPTPDGYEELIDRAVEHVSPFLDDPGVAILGMGVSLPGLVDYRQQRGLLSPNVPMTNGRQPTVDLAERLGIECVLVQELHGLCLAERCFGNAPGLDDFAVLDVSTGVGLGAMSGGRLLTGHSGLAGEIGHITVEVRGRRCGCGNYGCLETVASDSALAWHVSRQLGRAVNIDEVIRLARWGDLKLDGLLEVHCEYVAVALGAVINLLNPATLFVHGRFFELDDDLFSRVTELTRQRALPPSLKDCRIIQARGSKRQGALAAIIEYRIDSLLPAEVAEHNTRGAR